MPRYLFRMRMDVDYNELIEPELLSVADLIGVKPSDFRLSYYINEDLKCKLYSEELKDYYESHFSRISDSKFSKLENTDQNVFLFGTVPNDSIAKSIFSRCLLMRFILKIWAESDDYGKLLDFLMNHRKAEIEQFINGNKWCVKFSRYNNKSTPEDIMQVLESLFPVFEHAGEVDLNNPDIKIGIFEKYKVDTKTRNKTLEKIYFGNLISERLDTPWWNNYSLSNRPILGPTSLENNLSFILSNLGKVKDGSVVYDPFIGSGGSLISSTIFGFGSDIDLRILRGWGISYKNLNEFDSTDIFVNFKHYNLILPDILRFDIKYPPFNFSNGWIDAIITDPPYGNRASYMNNKLMKNINNDVNNSDNCFELINTLLSISQLLLVKNGRLVFLLPSNIDNMYNSLRLIDNDNFNLVYIGQQMLTAGQCRFIVTLERT